MLPLKSPGFAGNSRESQTEEGLGPRDVTCVRGGVFLRSAEGFILQGQNRGWCGFWKKLLAASPRLALKQLGGVSGCLCKGSTDEEAGLWRRQWGVCPEPVGRDPDCGEELRQACWLPRCPAVPAIRRPVWWLWPKSRRARGKASVTVFS